VERWEPRTNPLPITVAPLFNAELSANGPCFTRGVGEGFVIWMRMEKAYGVEGRDL
jgi:hypothetical protein